MGWSAAGGGGGGGRGNTYKLVRDYHVFVCLWEQFLSWGGFGRLCGSLSKPLVLAYVISTIISCWLGCSLLIRMLQIKINSTVVFVWFDLIILRLINNLSVIKGRGFLGWTSTKLGLMFLLNDTTQLRRWCSNPRPLGLESSTLPLSHSAPKQYQ